MHTPEAKILTAEQSFEVGGTLPQFRLILGPPYQRDGVQHPGSFQMQEHIIKTSMFRVFDDGRSNRSSIRVILGQSGDVFHYLDVRPHPKGNYLVQTETGLLRYDFYTWATSPPNEHLPQEDWLVPSPFRFKNTGNIQHGAFRISDVEKAIAKAKIPFRIVLAHAPSQYRIEYTGRPDLLREGEVYRVAKGVSWGVQYWWRAYPEASRQNQCGGFLFPDKAIAQAALDVFKQTGEKQECWNLKTLLAKFSGHPNIPAIEAWLNKEKCHV